jgi:hypothetical protein
MMLTLSILRSAIRSRVLALHARYVPAYLRLHRESGMRAGEPPRYRIEMPFQGLTRLSALPVFLGRSWVMDGPPPTCWGSLRSILGHADGRICRKNFGSCAPRSKLSPGIDPSRSFLVPCSN